MAATIHDLTDKTPEPGEDLQQRFERAWAAAVAASLAAGVSW